MSTAHLYLGEARNVISEPGLGLLYDFSAKHSTATLDLLRDGVLIAPDVGGGTATLAHYEPVGGYFGGQPTYLSANMALTDWTGTTDWVLAYPGLSPAGGTIAYLAHQSSAAYRLRRGVMPEGTGFYLNLVTYDTQADQGGAGTASPIVAEFGGVWKLELQADGQAILYRQETLSTGVTGYAVVAQFDWLTADTFAGAVPIPHWLWVYEVGATLVIRNLSRSLSGKLCGLAYTDPDCPEGWTRRYRVVGTVEPAAGTSISTAIYDGDTWYYRVKHALREGIWTLSGSGHLAANWSPESFVAGTVGLGLKDAITLEPGSTCECQIRCRGAGATDSYPTCHTFDQAGAVYPQGFGTLDTARTALTWALTWPSTATATYRVGAVDLCLPTVHVSDGATGVDLCDLTTISDRQITLRREGDLTREHLTATLRANHVDLASYIRPNMPVRFAEDSSTLFRGLTSEATWQMLADSTPPIGDLDLTAEGLWRRFRKSLWPGGTPFDGRLLTDCLTELLHAAGLGDDEIELCAWTYRFPMPDAGDPPALVWRPGTSIDRILEDLQEKFYGSALCHYFRLTDGKFVLAALTTTDSATAAHFYASTALAAAAGVPGQVIYDGSYAQHLDDSDQYNYVTVIGESPRDRHGRTRPLIARAIDWPSIHGEAGVYPSNYVGEVWPLIVTDPSLRTQATVNWVCRCLYEQHRTPRVTAEWSSLGVDVFPGDLVELHGDNHLDEVYRLTGMAYQRGLDGQAVLGVCHYSGVRV